jgi:hypothetical protein
MLLLVVVQLLLLLKHLLLLQLVVVLLLLLLGVNWWVGRHSLIDNAPHSSYSSCSCCSRHVQQLRIVDWVRP